MPKTNYPGIDYGLFVGSNRDPATGIRFGVISQHDVNSEAVQDVYYGPHSTDQAFEYYANEVKRWIEASIDEAAEDKALVQEEFKAKFSKQLTNFGFRYDQVDAIVETVVDELPDAGAMLEAAMDLTSDWVGEAFDGSEVDPRYDDGKYVITKCLDNDFFVLKSPYFTWAQMCSPCVPGAGNLGSYCHDGVKTFCLGPDWFDDNKAPYPVFSVETGERIEYGYVEEE